MKLGLHFGRRRSSKWRAFPTVRAGFKILGTCGTRAWRSLLLGMKPRQLFSATSIPTSSFIRSKFRPSHLRFHLWSVKKVPSFLVKHCSFLDHCRPSTTLLSFLLPPSAFASHSPPSPNHRILGPALTSVALHHLLDEAHAPQ